jgi:hypothetical protein
MQTSTGPAQRIEPTRHIDWARLADEQALSDQIWAPLPTDPTQREGCRVRRFLKHEGA